MTADNGQFETEPNLKKLLNNFVGVFCRMFDFPAEFFYSQPFFF